MEGLGVATNVINVVESSAKVTRLCLRYLEAVANAPDNIKRLCDQVKSLDTTLKHARSLVQGPSGRSLPTSHELTDQLEECKAELEKLRLEFQPGTPHKVLRRVGLRVFKWPLRIKEVEPVIARLERHQQNIMRGLQIDQTTLLVSINEGLENLSIRAAENVSSQRMPRFLVPFSRDPDFVNRPTIFAWLTEQYKSPITRMALVGLGGFGKSQIAIEFAHNLHEIAPETSIFWVHGSTKARFEESYRSLADAFLLPHRHDPGVDTLALVRNFLQRDDIGSWLLILDNADNTDVFFMKHQGSDGEQRPVASYLPKTENGKILITSRNMNSAEKLTGSHKSITTIPTMDSTEALELFRKKLGNGLDDDGAVELVCALGFVPLAVNQAAAYISRRAPRVSVRSYINSFHESEKKKTSLLNHDFGDLRRDESVSNSIASTWQVTFDQIQEERPTAASLLSLMSLFHPQNIPEYVLTEYAGLSPTVDDADEDDDGDFEEDLDVLRAYSLVNVSGASGLCDMHPLVQFCTQRWLSKSNDLVHWKSRFLHLIASHFPLGDFDTLAASQSLLPHVHPILTDEPTETLDILNWSQILTGVARYMITIGDITQAEAIAQRAVNARKAILGEEHLDTLFSMGNLARVYMDQGKWGKAEALVKFVIQGRLSTWGLNHPGTLGPLGDLSVVYLNQYRFAEAESLQVCLLEMLQRICGKEDPRILPNMNNLAMTFFRQRRFDEAELLFVQTIEISQRIIGEEHPETLCSIMNLAQVYSKQTRNGLARRGEIAKFLGSYAAEKIRQISGTEHPGTLTALNNLAVIYEEQEEFEQAEALLREALGISQRVRGEQDSLSIRLMTNLVYVLKELDRWYDSNSLYWQCMETIGRKAHAQENEHKTEEEKEATKAEIHILYLGLLGLA